MNKEKLFSIIILIWIPTGIFAFFLYRDGTLELFGQWLLLFSFLICGTIIRLKN